jgi:hypothetical protein
MSEKIINIHGIEVDRKTHPFDVSMRETIPTFIVEEIDTLLPFLNEYCSDGFLIYIHKTDVSRFGDSILRDGLLIHEEGGGLETTMSKVYDSKSKYEGGDKNYLFNCINKPNQYGTGSVLAVFPRKESKIFSPGPTTEIMQEICRAKKVSPNFIVGYVKPDGSFVPGILYNKIAQNISESANEQ